MFVSMIVYPPRTKKVERPRVAATVQGPVSDWTTLGIRQTNAMNLEKLLILQTKREQQNRLEMKFKSVRLGCRQTSDLQLKDNPLRSLQARSSQSKCSETGCKGLMVISKTSRFLPIGRHSKELEMFLLKLQNTAEEENLLL